jgi:hypothetical protein
VRLGSGWFSVQKLADILFRDELERDENLLFVRLPSHNLNRNGQRGPALLLGILENGRIEAPVGNGL